ncbi:hypothetical protein EAF00_012011 [Botryotinia globosa]|nr:hypothetical protein EAF00_012011 [Botryotinia globosa]
MSTKTFYYYSAPSSDLLIGHECFKFHFPPYLNLHIPPYASSSQIREAYRRHILALHPDKWLHRMTVSRKLDKQEMENQHQHLQRAIELVRESYDILSDSQLRQDATSNNFTMDWNRKEREFVYDAVEGEKCKGWVMGKENDGYNSMAAGAKNLNEKNHEYWKCWEKSLLAIRTTIELDECKRRQRVWDEVEEEESKVKDDLVIDIDKNYPPIPNLEPQPQRIYTYKPKSLQILEESLYKYERKPWFWKYPTMSELRYNSRNTSLGLEKPRKLPPFCVVSWVNGVHIVVDNWLKKEWSDPIWGLLEGVRESYGNGNEKGNMGMEMMDRNWQFWDGCDSFDLDVRIKTGGGKSRDTTLWSDRRSDTRWETLGGRDDLFCPGDWRAMVLIEYAVFLWIGWKVGRWVWWGLVWVGMWILKWLRGNGMELEMVEMVEVKEGRMKLDQMKRKEKEEKDVNSGEEEDETEDEN